MIARGDDDNDDDCVVLDQQVKPHCDEFVDKKMPPADDLINEYLNFYSRVKKTFWCHTKLDKLDRRLLTYVVRGGRYNCKADMMFYCFVALKLLTDLLSVFESKPVEQAVSHSLT